MSAGKKAGPASGEHAVAATKKKALRNDPSRLASKPLREELYALPAVAQERVKRLGALYLFQIMDDAPARPQETPPPLDEAVADGEKWLAFAFVKQAAQAIGGQHAARATKLEKALGLGAEVSR